MIHFDDGSLVCLWFLWFAQECHGAGDVATVSYDKPELNAHTHGSHIGIVSYIRWTGEFAQ